MFLDVAWIQTCAFPVFGKNMMVYAIDDEAIIVDCGMGFPEPSMHGINITIPDIAALDE